MCVPLLTSARPDPALVLLSLLSCLLGSAGGSLPSHALSPTCRTRQRKAASAQSSPSGGEGGSVLVGMESTASTGESGPPPLPDSKSVVASALSPSQAAPPASNRTDCQHQVDEVLVHLLLSSPEYVWRGGVRLRSHRPLSFRVTVPRGKPVCGVPGGRWQQTSGMDPLGWGTSASNPHSAYFRKASCHRSFLFN